MVCWTPVRVWFFLMALTLTGRAAGQPFSEGVDAPWSFRESGGICILERAVQDFGTVRFSAVPGGPLRLEILGHRDVFAAGAVSLYRVAPPWHEEHPRRHALGEAQGRAGSGILVGEPLATQVLMTLYEGYEAHIRHAAWYGGEADVRIGNVHLRSRYETFAGCLRGIEAAGWAQLERSRIGYPSGAVG